MTNIEIAIAQGFDRHLSPVYGLKAAPDGWVSSVLLGAEIRTTHRLKGTLIVSEVERLLAREAPDWFVRQIEPQYREDGTRIGPYIALREDSAEWLISVCAKIRTLLDQEIAEVTGRPADDR